MRVVQIGMGPLGRMVTALLVDRAVDIVGAVDRAPAIAGRSLADLVDGAPALTVEAGIDALPPDADVAIVTTSSSLLDCAADFRALLARGMAVVSSCEELIYPWARHDRLARELDAAARNHGGRLLGTGVNPGFLMDAFAMAASAVCTRVDSARIERIQDATTRRVPFQRKIGVGQDPVELENAVRTGAMGHVGLLESLQFLAAGLGLEVDRSDQEIQAVVADAPIASALGEIAAGQARGVRQIARGYAADQLVVELVFHAAVAEGRNIDRVQLGSHPPVELSWTGGVHGDVATTAILVNAVHSLLQAGPGLHTMLTVPMVRVHR